MTDHTLHGNHQPCPAVDCKAFTGTSIGNGIWREPIVCPICKGRGFVPLPDAEIVRRTCEEARRVYWPALEARIKKIK